MPLSEGTLREETGRGEPGSMRRLLGEFLEWMRDRGYSERTVEGRAWSLLNFIEWCEERGTYFPREADVSLVERYRSHLSRRISRRSGKPLRPKTQCNELIAVREFFRRLVKTGKVLFNPALEVELPKKGFELPGNYLSAREAERILAMPDVLDPVGLRDRAMMEFLYSTGIRRSELCNLLLGDVDFRAGTAFIRRGKGGRDRVIPAGERALSWVFRYLEDSRPSLRSLKRDDAGNLFLTYRGTPLLPYSVSSTVTKYRRMAGIEKEGSSHMFRHTTATLMLENGADVRQVQAMLGHTSLQSTQIYTHVSIRRLKEVHERTHPAKRLGPGEKRPD